MTCWSLDYQAIVLDFFRCKGHKYPHMGYTLLELLSEFPQLEHYKALSRPEESADEVRRIVVAKLQQQVDSLLQAGYIKRVAMDRYRHERTFHIRFSDLP